MPHLGDKVCSKACEEECPPGFSCQLISAEGSDPAYVCVSSVPHLCQPCTDSDQCDDAGLGAACVSYGDSGMFCGGACNETSECPAGFICELAETASGGTSNQCVAQSGLCACSDLSIELTLSTICAVSNEEGSCPGERLCGPEGLTECDAQPASVEICDGVDNDCDEITDEDVDCTDNDPCTTDTCMGPDGCVQTITIGASCDDGDIETGEDVCTEDGSCAGKPIECPPVGPCITQSAPNGEGCDLDVEPEGTLCDDENVGTTGDACDDSGTCVGTPYDCADEPVNTCTVTYVMDGTGCVPVYAPSDTPCDDDNNDTKDDVCDGSGTCGGAPYNCDDKLTSVCTPGYVPDGVGCTPQLAPILTPCEDDNDDTKNDVCNGAGGCAGTAYDCADEATTTCTPAYAPDGEGCIPQHALQGALCNDGNAATKDDACDGAGGCAGAAYDCADEVATTCTPSYAPDGVGCSPQHALQGALCDDSNAETKDDVCNGAGGCAGTAYDCADEVTTTCTPSYAPDGEGCSPQHALQGALCDDGNAETKDDVCDGAGGCAGAAYDCADEVATTCTPSYAPDGVGCSPQHALQGALCDDGNNATKDDACDGAGGCAGTAYDCSDQATDVCTPLFLTDGVGCAPQYAKQGTNCIDGNNNTKNDVCDGAGACAGTPYSCNDPTNPCLPSYTANGFGCSPNYAPPGTPCNDNQLTTFNDQCNGGGSCSGTPCQSRTITFGNELNNPIGSANLWFPGQEEQVYLESNAGRKAWVRVKYSETCNDAYVEMVSPSQHTLMCYNHGMEKCAPFMNVQPPVDNCSSNIIWYFDGQKKTMGDIAGCENVHEHCSIKGGAGKQLYSQNTTMNGCWNTCNSYINTSPNCFCTWKGYNVKP